MRIVCIAFLLGIASACSDDAPPPARLDRHPVLEVQTDSATAPVAPSMWDAAAGPVLLVAGERPHDAIVVFPDAGGVIEPDTLDTSDYVGAVATLLSRDGTVTPATLEEQVDEGEAMQCNSWPTLALPAGTRPWSIGFVGGEIRSHPLDSVQALARRDSARLVAQVARLASMARINTTGSHAEAFRGLPFVVHEARRFSHDSVEILVAQIVRRVNQEASPLEEHSLVIAERRADSPDWELARTEWTAGREETVGRQDLLGAVSIDGQPALVLVRDTGSSVRYAIYWRGAGEWSRQWTSAASRC